jgi:hypothetical protein
MILQRCLLLGTLTLAVLANACQTVDQQNPEKPEITSGMDLTEAYGLGRNFGGEVMQKVKELAHTRKEIPKLQQLTEDDLVKNSANMELPQLTAIVNTYIFAWQKVNPSTLRVMLESKSETTRRMAWRMAAMKPSPIIRQTLEQHINRALNEGVEDSLLCPEMALAIKENGMKSEYTFLVRGLETQGNPEYANAMLALDPKQATDPFLTYLMRADLDDLRQLNQKSVNVYTCTVIFRFLMENPLPLTHPGLPAIFMFAVSRNRGLADMANAVLEKHIPESRAAFAAMLSRLPVAVQIAFIENSQREMTANLRLLLSELKDVEQHKEVIEELNAPQAAGAQ